MKKTKDYRYWVYEHEYEEQSSFFKTIEGLIANNGIRLNALLLSSQENMLNHFQNWIPSSYKIKITNNEPIFSINLTKEGHEPIDIAFVKHPQNPSVYITLSDCKADEFKEFTKFINKYFPDISKIFLTNNEMFLIFKKIEKLGYTVMVEFSVGKKRLMGTKKESFIRYTNKPYKEVFEDIVQNDQWIQSVRYRADYPEMDENGRIWTAFNGTITRDCYYSIKKDFQVLIRNIIPYSLELASTRNKHLKLSVESADKPKPEAVVINFEKDIFTSSEKNGSYIDAITTMSSCSVSRYHSNPYLHISLVDYLDGSSYDLWVLTSDRMVIIPQFSASNASMRRLVNHVFERIHDGKVEKYREIKAQIQ